MTALLDRRWTTGTIPPLESPPQPPESYGWCVAETGRPDPKNDDHWSDEGNSRERQQMRTYGYRPYELQADHESPLFAEGNGYRYDLAHRDCVTRAVDGDEVSCVVLEWLRQHSPAEYAAIVTEYETRETVGSSAP